VIAIIGILAAIIIPTVGKVRESARSAQCKSNLRQIAMAAQMWSADNKGMIVPCRDTKESALGYGGRWPALLAKYLGRQADTELKNYKEFSIASCPSQSIIWGYGFNYISLSPWISGNDFHRVPLQLVTQPSRVIMFTDLTVLDSSGADKWNAHVRWPNYSAEKWNATPPAPGTIAFRHRNTCNVVWLDAHVSSEKPDTDFTNNNPRCRTIWGIDSNSKSLWTGQ
jgi:prepilin-type processing-associated H-X9-DG protein